MTIETYFKEAPKNSRLGIILHLVEGDVFEEVYEPECIVELDWTNVKIDDLLFMKNEVLYLFKK